MKAADVVKIAEMIGTARVTAVYYAMGITQHTTGHDNVRSIANLQMLCGNIGAEGGGINPLRGQSNVQGACDMGALPGDYPGYQKVTNPLVQAKFAQAWQCDHLPNTPGLTLTEMIDAAATQQLRGLYVMGENPVLSDPHQAHVIDALNTLDFLVVQDIFCRKPQRWRTWCCRPAHLQKSRATSRTPNAACRHCHPRLSHRERRAKTGESSQILLMRSAATGIINMLSRSTGDLLSHAAICQYGLAAYQRR